MHKETTFNMDTNTIDMKRNLAWVNSFNPYLTLLAASNTDIQPLLRCRSAINVIHYITMYMTKGNKVENYYALKP